MIKDCLPKVGIKLLKISHVRILFFVSLLFVAVINSYSVFKLIFKYSSTVWHKILMGEIFDKWANEKY